jgi:nickel transport protein
MEHGVKNRRWQALFAIIIVGFLICLGGVVATAAFAHGVVVFAWVEGDTVHVESKFSGGRKVKAGKLTILDAEGNELLKGTTDSEGNFNFPLPGRDTIEIVLEAGMGHRGQWTISAAEIAAARTSSPSERHRHTPADEVSPESRIPSSAAASRPIADGIDEAAVEAAVERALDRKLAPVLKMLAERRQKGPAIKDIIGGIGYILGLIGLAAYVHNRKKS